MPCTIHPKTNLPMIGEYESLLAALSRTNGERPESEILVTALRDSGDWTEAGAQEVVRLANDYGVFMLRNALALAIAMGKEDGDRGF